MSRLASVNSRTVRIFYRMYRSLLSWSRILFVMFNVVRKHVFLFSFVQLFSLYPFFSFLFFFSLFNHTHSNTPQHKYTKTKFNSFDLSVSVAILFSCTLTSDETVVIARQQSEGQGRGTNQWTSPLGCALFTIYFDVNLQSLLGQRLSLLQLVASVAVVQAIEKTADYKALNVRIKWPNDVFIGHDFAKLGGILATSSISGNSASIKLGIGVNVSNSEPSVCLNDAIDQQKSTKTLTHFTMEEFLGRTIGYFHQWISKLSQPNILQATISVYNFYQIYQSLWMHQNQEVFVEKWKEKVTIVGIDEYGFLKVRKSSTGDVLTLHADVHSFDVRNGVIYEKPI